MAQQALNALAFVIIPAHKGCYTAAPPRAQTVTEANVMPIPARLPVIPMLGLALVALCAPARSEPVPVHAVHAGLDAETAIPQPKTVRPALHARTLARLPRLAGLVAKGADIRIVAFGSSSTEGIGATSPAATYPAQLQEDLESRLDKAASDHQFVTVLNRGKGGDDAEAMARRLERDVLADKPDLVIWQTGSNDPMTGVSVERFAELTRAGILAIRATGADVILMDQQWCKRLSGTAGSELYGTALHAVASELDVPVIRRNAMMRAWVAKGLLTPTQMIGPDGLHMTDAGYNHLAKAAMTQILVSAGLPDETSARN